MDCEMSFEAMSSSGEEEAEEEDMEVSSNSLVDNRLLQKTMKQIFDKEKSKLLTQQAKCSREAVSSKTEPALKKSTTAALKRQSMMFAPSSDEDAHTSPKKSKAKRKVTISESQKFDDTAEQKLTPISPQQSKLVEGSAADISHTENSNDSQESSTTAVKIVGVIKPVEICEKLETIDAIKVEEIVEKSPTMKTVHLSPSKKILHHSHDEEEVEVKIKEEKDAPTTIKSPIVAKKILIPKPADPGKRARFQRCKECENCKRELKDSCGKCAPCQNKHWKKPCVLRQCVNKSKQERRKTKSEQIAIQQQRESKSKVIVVGVKEEEDLTDESPIRGSTAGPADREVQAINVQPLKNLKKVGEGSNQQPFTKFRSPPQMVVRPVVSMVMPKTTTEVKKPSLHCNICYTFLKSKDELISHLYDHFAEERSKEAAQKAKNSLDSTNVQTTKKVESPKKLLVHKFKGRSTPKRPVDLTKSFGQSEDSLVQSAVKKTSLSNEKIINPIVKTKKKTLNLTKKRGLFFEASSSEEESTPEQQHSKAPDRGELKCPHCKLVCKSQPGLRAHLLIYHPNHPGTANTQQSIFPAMNPSLSPGRTGPLISPSQRNKLVKNSPIITQKKLSFAESSSSAKKNIGHSVMLIDKQGKSINLIEKSSSGVTSPPTDWVEKQGDKAGASSGDDSANYNTETNVGQDSNKNNSNSGNVINNDTSDSGNNPEDIAQSSDCISQKINIRIYGNSSNEEGDKNTTLCSSTVKQGHNSNTGEIRLYI